jgi:hypothetical protein
MPPVVFEPTISASARPQTHALDREATGIGNGLFIVVRINVSLMIAGYEAVSWI